jgi:hypothetical protein
MLLTKTLMMTYSQELLHLFTGKIQSKIKTKVLLFSKMLNLGEDQKILEREEM